MAKGMKWTEEDLAAFQRRTAKPATARETEKAREVAANRQARQMLERVAEVHVPKLVPDPLARPAQWDETKRTKYKNEKTTVDGEVLDSKKEARRWKALLRLQLEGKITDLQRQVKFELAPSVKFKGDARAKPAIRFFADFTYMQDGELQIEDVKSAMTRRLPTYRLKRHLMLAVLKLEIIEI